MSEVPLYMYLNTIRKMACATQKLHFSGAVRFMYWGYSKLRTHTTLGPYCRAISRSIGPP